MDLHHTKMSRNWPSHRPAVSPSQLVVHDLGRMNYADAFAIQRRMQAEVIAARDGDQHMALLLVEHDPPVITISRRPGARQHLIATDEQLRRAGVEVCETDRGGDITYHGPGQLVVYPILDLNRLGLRLASYMRFLEQVVIESLARFGIEGVRDPSATGVWVASHDGANRLQSVGVHHLRKVCALGVRISKWVSMHGLALNVTTNLDHFNLIVPCGLAGRRVTSMKQELEARCPHMEQVKAAMIDRFRQEIDLLSESATEADCPRSATITP